MKKSGTVFLKGFVFTVILMLSACATSEQKGTDAAEQAIRQSLDDYGRTLRDRDIEGWLALHTDDVWKMPQNAQPTIGIEDLRKRITKKMEKIETVEFKVDIKEVISFGDYGYAMGYYWTKGRVLESGQNLPEFEGKFLTVFQRQKNGEWLISRDIYSSNSPAE